MRSRLVWIPLGVYLVSRVVDAVLIVLAMHHQPALAVGNSQAYVLGPMPASPGYLGSLTNWDGQWYERIALHGYPTDLPRNPDGTVAQNAWAFFPLYPALVRAVMWVTTAGFPLAGAIVSTTCGAGAAVLLYRMVHASGGAWAALVAVVALCTFPAAPVLQATYSESTALLVLLGCLWLLGRRRYGWLILGGLLLGLARPIGLPLAAVIVLHGWLRLRGGAVGRAGAPAPSVVGRVGAPAPYRDPFPVRERWWCGAAAVGALVGFALWPAIGALVTGDLGVYTQTQRTWYDHRDVGTWPSWLAHLLPPDLVGLAGLLILAVAVALVAGRWGRRWGELRLWSPIYVLYLMAATRPIPSIVRFLMLTGVPWFPVPSRPRRWGVPVLVLAAVVGVVAQWVWLRELYVIDDVSGYP